MTGWDLRWVATPGEANCGYWEVLHRGDARRARFRFWARDASAAGLREAQERARVTYRQMLAEEGDDARAA
jgi:hypothetical protein